MLVFGGVTQYQKLSGVHPNLSYSHPFFFSNLRCSYSWWLSPLFFSIANPEKMSQRSTPIGCGFGCGFLFEEKILFAELPCQKTIVFIGELPSISTPAKYPFWGFFRFSQFLRFIISYILTFRSYICILVTDISEKIVGFRKGEASFICITVMFFFNTAPAVV